MTNLIGTSNQDDKGFYLVCYVKYLNILVADLILHGLMLMVIEFIPVIIEQFYFLKSKNKPNVTDM